MQDALQTHPRALYARLGKQFIAGHWRDGRAGASTADIDPYSGSNILSIALANRADLDEAFAAAANAQRKWDAVLPAEKAAVFRRATSFMEDRHEEIVSWLVRESGSTRIKAELEWQFTFAMTIEASSFPYRVAGRIVPVDVPGKESRVYRRPIGVVGVISPWN